MQDDRFWRACPNYQHDWQDYFLAFNVPAKFCAKCGWLRLVLSPEVGA